MKKTLFLLITALIFIRCSSQLNNENIVGSWEVVDFESNTYLSPELIAMAKELAKTYIYQINGDETIGWKDVNNPDGSFGVWELDLEQRQISFTFEDPYGNFEINYEILEFNGNEMIWIDDMGELGQNIITLKRCDNCYFEKATVIEQTEIEVEELDKMSFSSNNLTDSYCDCMAETEKRESCIEPYDKARFEIKVLSDATKEKFKIENEYAPSDNEYIKLVKELRKRLVDCRNGFTEDQFIYQIPPSEK